MNQLCVIDWENLEVGATVILEEDGSLHKMTITELPEYGMAIFKETGFMDYTFDDPENIAVLP